MMTNITAAVAAEHQHDLFRAAERSRFARIHETTYETTPAERETIALRVADMDEASVVRRLAALDDARPLIGQTLLALIDGEAVAALSLQDGRVVANPFVRTEHAVALLRLRYEHLLGNDGRRHGWRGILRPRFA
jgi:hypothetical protein